MFVITVYGWEDRAGTRLVVGCADMAENTQLAAKSLGYEARVRETDERPNRTQEEKERGTRLLETLAPIIVRNQS